MSRLSPESMEQRAIVALYDLAGFTVYQFSQGFRAERGGTRQTPGPADLQAFHPSLRLFLVHEVKTRSGLRDHVKYRAMSLIGASQSNARRIRHAQAQQSYREHCRRCGVTHLMGGYETAAMYLARHGLVKVKPGGRAIVTSINRRSTRTGDDAA